MENIRPPLGAALRSLRMDSEVTQEDLAAKAGTTQSAIARLERASTAHVNTILRYLCALEVPRQEWPDVLSLVYECPLELM